MRAIYGRCDLRHLLAAEGRGEQRLDLHHATSAIDLLSKLSKRAIDLLSKLCKRAIDLLSKLSKRARSILSKSCEKCDRPFE